MGGSRIAITQRVVENASYPERRDALSQEWADFFASVLPWAHLYPVPNLPMKAATWARDLEIDGLVLSGGNDWGDAPERDETATVLFNYCRERGIPVLGVCRGLQVINHLLGGRIVTDLTSETGDDHVARDHLVELRAPEMARLAGRDRLTVNSFHNQGVRIGGLAAPVSAWAVSDHGVVEGLSVPGEKILAVQWHPERTSPSARFDRILVNDIFAAQPDESGHALSGVTP